MSLIIFLIVFPLIVALVLLGLKADRPRDLVVAGSTAVIAAASLVLAVKYFAEGSAYFPAHSEAVSYLMLIIEAAIGVLIFVLGLRHKKYLACVLALIQTPLVIWFELGTAHEIQVFNNLYVDRLSIVMVLIIGIIGSLICLYSLGYMKDFQKHHEDEKDRRPWFFFLMFLFLSAMFGLVTSNNLTWLFFFWEITTLCSFFLIGFTKTEEAVRNSFRALIMNLLGGLAFACALVVAGKWYGVLDLDQFIYYGSMGYDVTILAALLVFAGITKAAQMPFSSWLLGAMVAPTPTSALLHSSTMVKAGVFLIVKLAPVMGWGTLAGMMAMLVGGITFVLASCAAISQTNAKRVLAYSTVANLGLIVACGGIGSSEAVWAAIMLIIFHAIAKSLLFLCVGTAEHQIGSRDIEDMDGMFGKLPRIAKFMVIGICGMFLAPFGMLISKWAALKAFVDCGTPLMMLFIVFGSAVTLFFWTKWLGKLIAVMAGQTSIEERVHKVELGVLTGLAALVVVVCVAFPVISQSLVVPYLAGIFETVDGLALSNSNMIIMVLMVALVILLPLVFFGKTKKRIVPVYMAGVNRGDDLTFVGAMEKDVPVSLRNWYMEKWFGEKKMCLAGNVLTILLLVVVFAMIAGGVLANV
ncbi:MAG: proton-conducting transporter membrane subunit [Bacillota bacterium]|nr:proton-conducting transporter membrane subunit [Bacillota bacterium]